MHTVTSRELQVLTCGHSLGGAVATLAAFDVVRDCGVPAANVGCYTFGCPRVGNHAFAAEYEETVPNTWHVINDQDVVVHGMKLWGWYKRNGNRVRAPRRRLRRRPALLGWSCRRTA